MNTGKLAIGAFAVSLALGGGVAALTESPGTTTAKAVGLDEKEKVALRRDEGADEVAVVEDDDDRTRDGDNTHGNDGTQGGDNTGDGDATGGNDGTVGGDNTADASYGSGDTGGDTDGGSGGGTTG